MARIYANSCEKGLKNFNDVPNRLKDEVRILIESDGYEILEDGTVIKKEE